MSLNRFCNGTPSGSLSVDSAPYRPRRAKVRSQGASVGYATLYICGYCNFLRAKQLFHNHNFCSKSGNICQNAVRRVNSVPKCKTILKLEVKFAQFSYTAFYDVPMFSTRLRSLRKGFSYSSRRSVRAKNYRGTYMSIKCINGIKKIVRDLSFRSYGL